MIDSLKILIGEKNGTELANYLEYPFVPLVPVFYLSHNGTVGNNDWITLSSLTPDAKLVFPYGCHLKRLTWGNCRSSIETDWKIYKNGTSESDLVGTIQIREANDYGIEDLDLSFNSGDWIRILCDDKGTNMSDLYATLWGVFQ